MDSNTLTIIYIVAGLISLVILYYIIYNAVASATKEQSLLLKKQNDILLKMLNHMGVDKDELIDLFLNEKKEFWPSLKNSK